MKQKLAALALCAASLTAHAEFIDGNTLLSDLQSDASTARMAGLGYILGVTDAYRGATICMPSNVTAGQLVDMMRAWLQSNPAQRHRTGDTLVNYVLSTTWPCPKKQRNGSDV